MCLWGFLCTACLEAQGDKYSHYLLSPRSSQPATESQFERYPPWSCHGIDCPAFAFVLCVSYCLCLYGAVVGSVRHEKYSQRTKFEYYCSSQRWCCRCCHTFTVEDCLIGYFCCCCSVIQITMAMDELLRMKSKVEGDVNIKGALWKEEEKKYWLKRKGINLKKQKQTHRKKWILRWKESKNILIITPSPFFQNIENTKTQKKHKEKQKKNHNNTARINKTEENFSTENILLQFSFFFILQQFSLLFLSVLFLLLFFCRSWILVVLFVVRTWIQWKMEEQTSQHDPRPTHLLGCYSGSFFYFSAIVFYSRC